ncbi:MAG: hypothetical protein AB1698_22445 [Pseudomonadota bacterium]
MSSIYWTAGEARLKTYAAKTRVRGGAVISLEIEVLDAHALGWIMRQIEEIRSEQDKADKAAKAAEAQAQSEARAQRTEGRQARGSARQGRRSLPAAPHPLLLTYQGDDE